MKPRSEKLLNWAFIIALSLHGVALATAACLPTHVGEQDLTDLRVFEEDTPTSITPVELVAWPPAEPEPSVAGAPPIRARDLVVIAQLQPSRASQPRVETARPVVTPISRLSPSPAAPKPIPAVRTPAPPSSAGGGGGGEVGLGAPSTQGSLPLNTGGGTAMGSVPGSGSGSGAGTGFGHGGGSGGGTGGGSSSGTGPGSGSGTGSGEGAGGSRDGGGFTSRVADRAEPAVIRKGKLEYPPTAVEEGVEGTVKLNVLVTEAGAVAEVKVVQSSRDRRLDAAAIEFVRGWRYQPAVQDGQPRSVYTHASVRFELK